MVAIQVQQSKSTALPIDTVMHGECLSLLRTLPDCCIDAVVCDPPYGLGEVKDIAGLLQAWMQDADDTRYVGSSGFMNAEWDRGVPGPRYWKEVYRVMKPGAHILAFAGTRTYDLLVIALRLSGFEIRDQIDWIYGAGFPKSVNLGNGLGSALKPSHEPICLARKPLSEKTLAQNVLKWGTGGLAIDKCRINLTGIEDHKTAGSGTLGGHGIYGTANEVLNSKQVARAKAGINPRYEPLGRFPANTLFSHTLLCQQIGVKRVKANGPSPQSEQRIGGVINFGLAQNGTISYRDTDGCETVEDWMCDASCPIAEIDRQSGVRKSGGGIKAKAGHTIGFLRGEDNYHWAHDGAWCEPSEGGASRYFQQFSPDALDVPFLYTSKASRRERNQGCEGLPEKESRKFAGGEFIAHPEKPATTSFDRQQANNHPTVKPLALLKYLITMICPSNGIVLDPFLGSGSTAVAAIQEGFHFIGMEQDASYVQICEARIQHAFREVEK